MYIHNFDTLNYETTALATNYWPPCLDKYIHMYVTAPSSVQKWPFALKLDFELIIFRQEQKKH